MAQTTRSLQARPQSTRRSLQSSTQERASQYTFDGQRKKLSLRKIAALEKRLNSCAELKAFPKLTIYATGSYARLEASQHSDIDLFFLIADKRACRGGTNMDMTRVFSKIIEICDDLGFPEFSNDGEFLHFIYLEDILKHLGGRDDDSLNLFTARMLLLLESRPVYGADNYHAAMKSVVDAYFRDYPHHPDTFRPTFFINDVVRFWKTLCLNYEHKRNQPSQDVARKTAQKIRNFKLKYSRLVTCYATMLCLVSQRTPVNPKFLLQISALTPASRLRLLLEGNYVLSSDFEAVEASYRWFLERTNLSAEKLQTVFMTQKTKEEAFDKANEFGDLVFRLIMKINVDRPENVRYLIV